MPRRSTSTTDDAHTDDTALLSAARDPEPALRYLWHQRLLDIWAGRRDGAQAGAVPAAPPDWWEQNKRHFIVGAEQERLTHQDAVRPALERLSVSVVHEHEVRALLADAERGLAELRERGPAESVPGPAEHGTSQVMISTRRAREHERALALASEQRDQVARTLSVVLARRSADQSLLDIARAATRSRVVRLLEHHERRAARYRRPFVRAMHRRGVDPVLIADHPVLCSPTLTAPRWWGAPDSLFDACQGGSS